MNDLRQCTAWIVLAGLLAIGTQAVAQPASLPDEGPLQLFSTVNRDVVAVGEPFAFTVEVYASLSSRGQRRPLEQAVASATFARNLGGLTLVRQERRQREVDTVEASPPVLVLERQFVFRAQRPGTVSVPALQVRVDGRTFATRPHQISVYELDEAFFDARSAIFPVVAEPDGALRRRFARTGSAFLIASNAVVTSFHVIMEAERVRLELPSGERLTTKKVWMVDPIRDIAVLYVDPDDIREAGVPPLQLAPAEDAVTPWVRSHDDRAVFTYGWPRGTQRSTSGIRYQYTQLRPNERLWLSTNPLGPGDSGGPLLDRHGRVLGVVTSGTTRRSGALFREEVCIATDPRPVLARKLLVERPRSLRSYVRDEDFQQQPHVQVLRLAASLRLGRHRMTGLDESMGRMERALERYPDDVQLQFMGGVIREQLGLWTEAADAYRATLEAFDGHFPASYMLGRHQLRQRQYDKARALFAQTRRYEPYARLADYGMAKAFMGQLRYADAIPHLRSVLHRNPDFVPAFYDLALCHLALGDTARAWHLVVKMESLRGPWAQRLRYVLTHPVLHPTVLQEQPRAALALPDGISAGDEERRRDGAKH